MHLRSFRRRQPETIGEIFQMREVEAKLGGTQEFTGYFLQKLAGNCPFPNRKHRQKQMVGFPASSVNRKRRNGPCFLYLRFEILHPIGPKWMGELFRPHKLRICPSKFW